MGGIFGVICSEKIGKGVVIEGLKRLIYRGYDGAGVAFLDPKGNIIVKKAPGHLDEAVKKAGLDETPSDIVLGHVRYASRGWPSYENTHPLLDCDGKIAVVGDGVIENYEDVKKELEKKGHKFSSRTDTEVFAHLLEELVYKDNKEPLIAMAEASRKLSGVYAIAALFSGRKKLYAVNMGQPIVIGLRNDGRCVYISSDIPSLYGFADEALILEEGMAAEVGLDEIKVIDISSFTEVGELKKKRVKYPIEVIDKAGFPHFMLKEIYEIPDAIIRTTYSLMEKYLRLASMIIYGAKNVYIIANGTSLHAGLVSSYYFADLAGINVNVVSAAEFPYYALENVSTGTVVIAISQSGETSDVIKSVKLAKQRGAVIVGVTNVVGSRLTLESNVYLPIGAGPEIAVPATKTFISTLTTMAILAGYTGLYTGTINYNEFQELIKDLREHAKKLRDEIKTYDKVAEEISSKLLGWHDLYVVSSGINYPVALEAALKLKETAMLHAEGVQLGELRHGPMVLVRENYPIIFIKPIEEAAIELYNRVAREALSKGALIVTVTQDGEGYGLLLKTKPTNRVLSPITSIIPLQLLAYHIGRKQGLPIDTPPGLAKAITT
ncbi:glutamine--fructose-6-phosphate transaminase (isomerizing) [Desulfurococcaceae archaeon MEX13E-LK6-19]|nr:glutamine--fructose-6-phosphate transaminase (isomerizing) [Desulfurococcaceae archaeon MEX13E-LK6-19]